MIYRAVRPLGITYFSTNSLYYLLIPGKALPSLSQIMRWERRAWEGSRETIRQRQWGSQWAPAEESERKVKTQKGWRTRSKGRGPGGGQSAVIPCWALALGKWWDRQNLLKQRARRHFTEINKLKWGHWGSGGRQPNITSVFRGWNQDTDRDGGKTMWRQRDHHLQAKETSLRKSWFCQHLHLKLPHLQKSKRTHVCV